MARFRDIKSLPPVGRATGTPGRWRAVFFAATELHAALPVKEGVRDSLIVWFSEGS